MRLILVGMNARARPTATELASYYQRYVDRCEGDDLMDALRRSLDQSRELFERIPEDMGDHRYAPGKWTIKDVAQHMIDSERVFAYRALRFARNDATPLPGFEEDDYARNAPTASRSLDGLATEMGIVRRASMLLFQSFDGTMLLRQGIANGNPFSVRALGWIIAGHNTHHLGIINERYLRHAGT